MALMKSQTKMINSGDLIMPLSGIQKYLIGFACDKMPISVTSAEMQASAIIT
jgi:hypothetical protein